MIQVTESDWKLFRQRIPEWQERYMDALLREYAALLARSEKASNRFWSLEKRIHEDRQRVGAVARMSRSSMYINLLALLRDGAITLNDLDGFSDDLRKQLESATSDLNHATMQKV